MAFLAIAPVHAHAQSTGTAGADTADTASTAGSASANAGDIVVTGTRIVQDGYSAPVSVNVLGAAEINAQKPANIADMVRTLPFVTSNTLTPMTGAGTLGGNAGINAVNLRGLGAARTLVLLNGQRSVGSTFSGLVDINTFPQDLIERVEVVTGGASAQYGSDAVGGVVNFILNDKFKGLKLGADTGITTYGDGFNYRFTGTAGLSFLDDRLHILLNGEYFKQKAIETVDRPWNDSGFQMITNPAYTPTNGQPQFFVGAGIGPSTKTLGGLITSGPLRGTYFLEDGVAKQLNYGTVADPWMIGGDWQIINQGGVGTNSLVPAEERIGAFNRIAFDVTPDITIYGQFSWNRFQGPAHYGTDPISFNILADNAYLLTQYPQVAAAMQAQGLSSINVGAFTGFYVGSDNSRQVFRYLSGGNGKFSLFNRPWSWDVYY